MGRGLSEHGTAEARARSIFRSGQAQAFGRRHSRRQAPTVPPAGKGLHTTARRRERMLKRLFDILASAIALPVALPVIGLFVIAIRMDSPGPGLFRQERVGRDGRPFTCLKLRTMRQDAPHLPTHLAGATHLTSLGRHLRRWKIDELPQLWNVLTGDMSFVGPRPCLPSQIELVAERRKRGVLAAKPGITGLAQVKGIDMSDPVLLSQVDAQYVRSAGILMDLRLILATFSKQAMNDRTGGRAA